MPSRKANSRYFLMLFLVLLSLSFVLPNTSNDHQSIQLDSNMSIAGSGDNNEDFVDQLSDLYAPSDIGTHSVFADLQDFGSNYDQMTEADQGSAGNDVEDFVDQISDLHPEDTDIGTHSDFAEEQDKDSVYDTLTEANTGSSGVNEWLENDADGTDLNVGASHVGTSIYLEEVDTTNYLAITKSGATPGVARWYTFDNTVGGTSSSYVVNLSIYVLTGDGGDDITWHIDTTGDDTAEFTGTFLDPTSGWYNTGTISNLDTDTEIDAARVSFTHLASGPAEAIHIDATRLGVGLAGGDNFDLDLEIGWTTADFDETNEYLCIFGGTQDSEALRVDIWDDVSTNDWVNVISDLAAGWNNVSLNSGTDYLHDTSFEVRFTDTTGDSVEADTWQVEGVLLHCWTTAFIDYELDLEIGWTTADFDETTGEELCIYPVTGGGWPSEAIIVEVYSGGWQQVFADLTPDEWNNVSVASYLTDPTFEMRFLGGTETGDSTQSTWEIDAVLLHTWTTNYAPANDQDPTIANADDDDFLYAKYRYYLVTSYVSDADGYADITYVELSIWDNSRSVEYIRIRYTVSGSSFSIEAGSGYISLLYSSVIETGNDIDVTWSFKVDWDFPDLTDLDTEQYVIDSATDNDTDFYESDWNIETRLDYTVAPYLSDARGNINTADLTAQGTVIYYGSVNDYPYANETDVWTLHDVSGTWSGDLSTGTFNIGSIGSSASVRLNTYTFKTVIQGAGSGGADLYYTTSLTTTFITDQIVVQTTVATDNYIDIDTGTTTVNVTLWADYDDAYLGSGDNVYLNASLMTWDTDHFYLVIGPISVFIEYSYVVSSATEVTYSVTSLDTDSKSDIVSTDRVIIIIGEANDTRTNIDTWVEVNLTLGYESGYDTHFPFELNLTDGTYSSGSVSDLISVDDVSYIFFEDVGDPAFALELFWNDTTDGADSVHVYYYVSNAHPSSDIYLQMWNFTSNVWVSLETLLHLQGWYWLNATFDDSHFVSSGALKVRIYHDGSGNANYYFELDHICLHHSTDKVVDGTVTINGVAATHMGNGVWQINVVKSSVQLVCFINIVVSGNIRGITVVNESCGVNVIWDSLTITLTDPSDQRNNINTNATGILVSAIYDYDSTSFDGSFTLNDTTYQYATVGIRGYTVSSTSGDSYGITTISSNDETFCIWDSITAYVTGVDEIDHRFNVGDNATGMVVWGFYDYDSAPFDGTLILNDTTYLYNTVGRHGYEVGSGSGDSFGISVISSSNATYCIWDRILFYAVVVDESNPDVGGLVNLTVVLRYEYDNQPITTGTFNIRYNGTEYLALTYDVSDQWIVSDSSAFETERTYNYVNGTETTYSITVVNQNSAYIVVTWGTIATTTTTGSGGSPYPTTTKSEYDLFPITTGVRVIFPTPDQMSILLFFMIFGIVSIITAVKHKPGIEEELDNLSKYLSRTKDKAKGKIVDKKTKTTKGIALKTSGAVETISDKTTSTIKTIGTKIDKASKVKSAGKRGASSIKKASKKLPKIDKQKAKANLRSAQKKGKRTARSISDKAKKLKRPKLPKRKKK